MADHSRSRSERSIEALYEWLAPKLSTEERKALTEIYYARVAPSESGERKVLMVDDAESIGKAVVEKIAEEQSRSDKYGDEEKVKRPLEPGEAVDLFFRIDAALALGKGHDWQDRDAWRKFALSLAKRFDSLAPSHVASNAAPQGAGLVKASTDEPSSLAVAAPVTPSSSGSKWIPIDTAPKDGTDILLTTWGPDGYGEIDVGAWGFIEKSDADGSDVIGWLSNYGRIFEPTHWIPLPIPPESGVTDKS